nr:hypothetical protein [uncultured Cohaesibacter sp.]
MKVQVSIVFGDSLSIRVLYASSGYVEKAQNGVGIVDPMSVFGVHCGIAADRHN